MIGSCKVQQYLLIDRNARLNSFVHVSRVTSRSTLQLPIACVIRDYSVGDHALMADCDSENDSDSDLPLAKSLKLVDLDYDGRCSCVQIHFPVGELPLHSWNMENIAVNLN